VCVVTGASVTCNSELCSHLCMECINATFSAVECVLIFFGAVCVSFCCALCGYERSIELVLFCIRSMRICMLLASA
jgi:hypothetical protein